MVVGWCVSGVYNPGIINPAVGEYQPNPELAMPNSLLQTIKLL